MLLAFQIILFVFMLLFGTGLFADERQVSNDDKGKYLSVVLASIVAMTISFFV